MLSKILLNPTALCKWQRRPGHSAHSFMATGLMAILISSCSFVAADIVLKTDEGVGGHGGGKLRGPGVQKTHSLELQVCICIDIYLP